MMDIVVLHRNGHDLKRALRTLRRFTYGGHRVIPVSISDGRGKALARGLELSSSELVAFFDSSVLPSPGWNVGLAQALREKDAGLSAPLTNVEGIPQSASKYISLDDPLNVVKAQKELYRRFRESADAVKFLLSLLFVGKREALEKVGGFDPFLDDHLVDLDLSLRLRLEGYKLLAVKGSYFYADKSNLFDLDPYPLYRKVSAILSKVPTSQEMWGIKFKKGVWKGEITRKTSIVIPVFNRVEYTIMCIEAIKRWTYPPYEIIVVDNGSTDGTSEYIPKKGVVYLKLSQNHGFSRAVNIGIEASKGDYVCIMNNDVVVSPGWLEGLIEALEMDQTLGIVGPVTNEASGPQKVHIYDYEVPFTPEYRKFVKFWSERNTDRLVYTFRVSFFCTLIKRKVFQDIGLLDPNFGVGGFEDDDFCMRAVLGGYKIAIVKSVFVHHFGSATLDSVDSGEVFKRNWLYFSLKWRIPPEGCRIKGNRILYRPEEILKRWAGSFQVSRN